MAAALPFAALPAAADTGGPQPTSQSYSVNSLTVPGVDTGFKVLANAPVTVTASGTVNCGPWFCMGVGPDGSAGNTTDSSFLVAGVPAWGLVARVGNGPWMQVGSGPTTVSGSGDLQFAMNDNYYPDNSGSFNAVVSYTCFPGNGNGDTNHYHCGPPGQR